MSSIVDLPDLALERIFEHLPTLFYRIRIERVCHRWKQIVLSMWKRIKVIDGDLIGGGFKKFNEFCGESDNTIVEQGEDALALVRNYRKMLQTGAAVLNRIDSTDNQIYRVCFQKDIVVYSLFVNELLAKCQNLREIVIEDACIINEYIETAKAFSSSSFGLLEAPLAQLLGTHLKVFSIVGSNDKNVDRFLNSDRFFHLFSSVLSLVAFGIDDSCLSYASNDKEKVMSSLSAIITNNSTSLRALRMHICDDFIRYLLSKFARDRQQLIGITWLRIDYSLSHLDRENWRLLLGLMPNIKFLILNVVFGDNELQELGFALSESYQILALKLFAVRFNKYQNVPLFFSNCMRRRNSNLQRLRLILSVAVDDVGGVLAPDVFVPGVGNQIDIEFERANVDYEYLDPDDWQSIADLDFSSDL